MIRFHSSLVLTMTAALLAGCAAKRGAKTAPTTAAPVHIVIAESKERVATEEEAGTVQAKLHAVIAAQISGRVETMLVSPGQPVTAGELLVTISAREVQAQYEQALAQRQLAASNLRRATNLLNERVLSQAEFDQAQARFRVADAAAMEARTLADYAQVRAPFTGIITRKDADQGDLATPGKALLEMEDPTALRLEANVPEDLAGNVKVGDTLNVRIGALQTN
ncbi:MAG: efflux RND transporter periplasmic adaptor subunit, partial [Verrucomicrobia bacterium]|nr:efflux RND transporter periplasmic adaptor subunit [Verrucomicrobiota bacterium]